MAHIPVTAPTPPAVGQASGFKGWAMVARAFVCQNVANGFLFGTFGTTLIAAQDHLNTSRATVALGMAFALLTMGLISPLTPRMLEKLTLRWTMFSGVILSGTGYFILAIAPNSLVFLLAYAFLIGPSIAMFGSLMSSILASNWFVSKQGTAVGIVNVSLFVTLAPLLAVALLERYGLTTLYLFLAAAHLLLLPVVFTIIDRPERIGQQALGAGSITATPELQDIQAATQPARLLTQKSFWLMVIGGGTLNAIAIIAMSHIVALAVERGLGAVEASLLVSVIGGAAMLGALLVGALCDKLGPARALALAAVGLSAAWACILLTTWLPALFLAVALHGICAGGVFPAISVLARRLFGADAMARAIGAFFPLTLPLTFCAPPLAGWIRDVTGSYDLVILVMIIAAGLVSALFFLMWQVDRRLMKQIQLASAI